MPRKGSNIKESVEESEKPVETKEEIQEKPVVEEKIIEKIVEKPLDLAEKSPEELAQFQEDIKNQELENHIKAENKRIKDISCPKCDKNLGLKPENYLKKGNLPEVIECKNKKCESLVRVYVNYKDDPSISDAEITTKGAGYAWINQLPSTWKDKHAVKWVEMEKARLDKNQSVLSPDNQKLFRVQILILQKLGLIK